MRNLGGCRGPWGVTMGEGAESFCKGVTRVNKAAAPDFETCCAHI